VVVVVGVVVGVARLVQLEGGDRLAQHGCGLQGDPGSGVSDVKRIVIRTACDRSANSRSCTMQVAGPKSDIIDA
jgi:hypothetical protein